MVGPRETLDVDAAVLDPADHFESPMNVVRDPRSPRAKSNDFSSLGSATPSSCRRPEAENMQGTERPRLQEAKLALLELQKQK